MRAGMFCRAEKNVCRVVPSVDISSAVVYYGEPSRIETGYGGVAGVVMNCRVRMRAPEDRARTDVVFPAHARNRS